jgi:hypothetical protein
VKDEEPMDTNDAKTLLDKFQSLIKDIPDLAEKLMVAQFEKDDD